jgi:hypothetical protein
MAKGLGYGYLLIATVMASEKSWLPAIQDGSGKLWNAHA